MPLTERVLKVPVQIGENGWWAVELGKVGARFVNARVARTSCTMFVGGGHQVSNPSVAIFSSQTSQVCFGYPASFISRA